MQRQAASQPTMALILNFSDLTKKLITDPLQMQDSNIDKTEHFLIIQNGDTLRSNAAFNVEIPVQRNPEISCKLRFSVSNYCLQGNLDFLGNVANVHYEMDFHYISSRNTLEFLETLNVLDITSSSTYYLKQNHQFFDANGLESDKFVNRYLYMLVSFKKKDKLAMMRIDIPKREMPQGFIALYNDQILTDFTILCKNKEFFVHKAILAGRSPIFQAMLQHPLKESKEGQIEINDFQPEIVERMLYFIYTDEIENDLKEKDLQQLLIIADKYSLDKLKMICMKEISKSIESIEDTLEAFTFANCYNVTDFKGVVLRFIKENQHILLK